MTLKDGVGGVGPNELLVDACGDGAAVAPPPPAPGRRRASVRAHLAWSFSLCVAVLLVLVATTTNASFQRERSRAAAQLETAASSVASSLEDSGNGLITFLAPLAAQPPLNALSKESCDSGIASLMAMVERGHLHLYDARGQQLCAVTSPRLPSLSVVPGDWFQGVLTTGIPYVSRPQVDSGTGGLATAVAVQVKSPSGAYGVLLAVINVDGYGLELPPGMPSSAELLVLDQSRTNVLAGAASAANATGRSLTGRLAHPIGRSGTTIDSPTGHTLLAVEASVRNTDLVVVVGIPPDTALAAAHSQFRLTAAVGLLVIALVGFVGLLLNRRLAHPVRHLKKTVEAAGDGDETAWAATEGPAEYAQLAVAFNDMLAERRTREADLRYRATHDVLTGLPNRAALTTALRLTLDAGPASVLFLDLDRFKLINDTHGHQVGDRLLISLGERLRAAVGPGRMVARFGGDEFVVLDRVHVDEDHALTTARSITGSLEAPFLIGDLELYVTGSVGVSLAATGVDPDVAIREADTAMYRAKEQGRPGYAVYGPAMRDRSARRLALEQDLHLALDRGELAVHYQPVCSVATGEMVGAEALLRWTHPVEGPISPSEFIPVAEEAGLIMRFGEWVLLEGCRQAAAWRQQFGRPVPVSVNLSARQLNWSGLPAQVARCLDTTGACPGDLVLEITEHGMLEDYDVACRQIDAIRDMGVRMSVDDFGTGWSSLSYLQRLPVDELKIDRSFIATLGEGRRSSAIIGSLVALAHGLGLEVVAEGVEECEQLDELGRLGCDRAQGFLLARPSPAGDIRVGRRRVAAAA